MKFVSIQPLLDALDRAGEATIDHFRDEVGIERILVSSDLRQGVIASAFVASDAELARLEEDFRGEIATYLRDRVADEHTGLPRENRVDTLGEGCRVNWHSSDELQRDWGGSYDRYMRG